jgi:hypothetical protein
MRRDTQKGSLSIKLQRAGWDDGFLCNVLNDLATASAICDCPAFEYLIDMGIDPAILRFGIPIPPGDVYFLVKDGLVDNRLTSSIFLKVYDKEIRSGRALSGSCQRCRISHLVRAVDDEGKNQSA